MASRVFVQDTIADKFIETLKGHFESVGGSGMMGDPSAKETQIGPLADKIQYKRVMDYIEQGKKDGELVTGGVRWGDKGLFVEPTIFKNTPSDAQISKEEVFGPVVTVQTFKNEDEAVQLANDTIFGLSG